jgi:hypothetical protein
MFLISIPFTLSYVRVFNAPSRIFSTICGIGTAGFATVLTLILPEFNLERGVITPYAFVIILVMFAAFVVEIVRRKRADLINSVSVTTTLSLFASSICGWALTWRLVSGLYFGYILLNLIPFVVVGLLGLIFSLTQISERVRFRVSIIAAVVSVFAAHFLLWSFTSGLVFRSLDSFYTSLTVVTALCVTRAKIGGADIEGDEYPKQRAVLKGLFPIATIGLVLYIICIVVQR